MTKNPNRSSHKLTFDEAVEIHLRIADGELYSRIAARFDVNQGRVADVKFGRIHPGSADQAQRLRTAA